MYSLDMYVKFCIKTLTLSRVLMEDQLALSNLQSLLPPWWLHLPIFIHFSISLMHTNNHHHPYIGRATVLSDINQMPAFWDAIHMYIIRIFTVQHTQQSEVMYELN